MVPHSAPRSGQVSGVQPHVFEVAPPPHVSGGVQRPHCTVPPHPSEISPQLAPRSAQARGEQGSSPHLFRPPPPHTPIEHEPHSLTPPHPSGILPHSAPTSWHVLGMQPGPSMEEASREPGVEDMR
jgi:hypothetical protein